ncbi:MAG: DNA polymerase/3'-5' exonuclease PolX, partial [Proteobacteria bacterium]|nr:DNA polymerase/3'-5' exonuclease PolX [Pseudomonadota bacterium]
IAAIFFEMADLLHIQGGNRYRIRAFTRAGRVIENLPEPAAVMIRFGTLEKKPGIGPGTVHHIEQILRSGTCDEHQQLRRELPPGLRDMLEIKGVGARTVRVIYQHLRIGTVEELELAARSGRLSNLPRLGERSTDRIIRGIDAWRHRVGRIPFANARGMGLRLVGALKDMKEVQRIALAGSIRRGKATIGDLDILVGADDAQPIMARFCTLPLVEEVLVRGEGRTSVRLQNRQQCDLRLIEPETFGAGMHYFTGAQLHNIHLRARGNRFKLKISENGIFRRADELRLLAGRTEEEVFAAVGLPWIPPELRENLGEIEAAAKGRLPRLVTEDDLAGDLHLHTTASDGRGSMEDMAHEAIQLGYQYIAITDHTASCAVARGQDEGALADQMDAIKRLDRRIPELKVLAGVEVDILPDGSLDIDEKLLRELDWVIASVHFKLEMNAAEQTDRVIAAIESGVVDCIGHPTNRKLGHRPSSKLNFDRLCKAARKMDVALEVNGHRNRMDLEDVLCRRAIGAGVMLVVNTDAHSPAMMHQREFGLLTARRGWVEARHVLNTKDWSFISDLRQRRLKGHRQPIPLIEQFPSQAAHVPELQSASGGELAVSALIDELRGEIDQELRLRLKKWMQIGNDLELEEALRHLHDQPMQAAFNLLFGEG